MTVVGDLLSRILSMVEKQIRSTSWSTSIMPLLALLYVVLVLVCSFSLKFIVNKLKTIKR